MKTIWLAGATGLVGQLCLDLLLADPQVGTVVAVGRRAPERSHPKLRFVATERFDDLAPALQRDRPAAVLCALGTTIKKAGSQAAFREVDQVYPLRLAEAAKTAGVGVFGIVTAVGASAQSGIFYNRVKGELEQALATLQLPTVHVLHPSLLLGHRAESRPAERLGIVFSGVLRAVCVGPWRKYRPIRAAHVAQALARAAHDTRPGWHVHEGKELEGGS
jgi:uncharacterized protein YbjT (DUF2867 family)